MVLLWLQPDLRVGTGVGNSVCRPSVLNNVVALKKRNKSINHHLSGLVALSLIEFLASILRSALNSKETPT